ncbi:valine--tRNA ligase [Syntrophus aciditrophicus]|uniref:Valine--tRNA ligase n=1 Tax=Syntrophus aciditrophicus (strain SB) TaxID=56780 RepID=Q2LUR2_SYNAS|nr:valine--tRNA ligase [Syntrophus aciditrophicus]ABC77822.1 valyl-tRNA synthetase [Syntrophus aciditrophicus SB]OPY18781.1 MAG: Valine--tRNA ligase [Syntrophus sp. PtaB.Bin075]
MDSGSLNKAYEPHEVEARWYQYWVDSGFFHAEDAGEKPPFSIVIPPPNVTGILHMGHALNNTLQDIIVRFKRMQGYNTLWMPGMDHAGIATQNVVEKELAREGLTRHDLGREKFIERVWEWKAKYGGVIINQLKRLGCSCDWERQRFTMDEGLSRAVREVFVRLYQDDLIYQGDYIVNWCPRCHTAISDLEVEYKEEAGSLWNIRYPLADGGGDIIVATTRPETMLGDTAVAVHPDDPRYRDLVGKEVILPLVNRKIPIIADDYVTMEFGSGAVKITPSSDPADFAMAERHSLKIINIMDGSAVINENGGPYQGQDRYECRKNIVADLKEQGYLVSVEPYMHNVGKCYRCKTDIEPYVSKQWFVRIKPLAKAAISAVVKGKTRIIPPMWEATYYEWMNNIRDWCISRQIWWGHRIPVWTCESCGRMIVSTQDPDACPDCGSNELRQEEDVLDTWFSSALWPFSTLGWPDRTPALKTFYPTSLLITGFDILFFWVARMMMMGKYIMKDVPFRDVYLHALVRDEKGEKMSKSKGNSIDPLDMIDKYGTDAFRFTLAAFSAQGRDVRMSEERIEGYKFFVNKIWNAARFSLMNLEDYPAEGAAAGREEKSLKDRWILSRLQRTTAEVVRSLDEYRFNDAAAAVYSFFWHEFCDWYLELIKPTLYGKETPEERMAAQLTLKEVLKNGLKLLHPFMPFITEEIWQKLTQDGTSIMVSPFPSLDESQIDEVAEREMGLVMDVITSIRNIRGEMGIAPSKKLRVIISAPRVEEKTVIASAQGDIINLAGLAELAIEGDMEEPKGVATGVVGAMRIFVLLEGLINIAEEKARLEKEMAKLEKDLAIVARKLANRDFLEKAAEAVIRKEEEKYKALRDKNVLLKAAFKKFQIMEVE